MESLRNLLLLVIVVALSAIGGYFLYTEVIDNKDKDTSGETTNNTDITAGEPVNDIVELTLATDELSSFADAITAADLARMLQEDGPYTVLVPSNTAFATIQETFDTLLQPENKEDLVSVLQYHIMDKALMSEDLQDGMELTMMNGGTVKVEIDGDTLYFIDEKNNKAMVITKNVEATNGIIYIIDTVLMQ